MACTVVVSYPGTSFDECLNHLSNLNEKITGSQIAPHIELKSIAGIHFKSGCFELNGVTFLDHAKSVTFEKFGPLSKPEPDPNVKRILRGEKYDHPPSPFNDNENN